MLATLLLTACLMVEFAPHVQGHGHEKAEEEAKEIVKKVLKDAANGTNHSNETAEHDVEKELEKETLTVTAPVLIMGGLAFNMFFFYLVNAEHKVIRDQTWTMLNMAVSIFCAVLFNSFWNMLLKYIFNMHDAHGHHVPDSSQVISAAIQFLAWWFAFTFVAFYLCSDILLQLKGWGTIGGHIMGFASIHLFGTLAETETFRSNTWFILLLVLIFAAVWAVLMALSRVVGTCVERGLEKSNKINEKEMERWHDQSKETGIDFFSLGAGFLISLWVRFLITGHLPGIEQSTFIADERSTFLLYCNALLLLLLGCVFAFIRRMVTKKKGRESTLWTVINLVDHALFFAGAWVLLFSLQWHFSIGPLKHTVMARASVACVASVIAIIFILVMSGLFTKCVSTDAKPLFRGMFMALSLCMGLSWEKTFDASIEGLAEHIHEKNGISKRNVKLWVCAFDFFLFIIVFPAWMAYMLPKSDPELQEEYKGKMMPFYAACCMPADSDVESDYEEDEEDEEDQLMGES
jgi:hypothetical protein